MAKKVLLYSGGMDSWLISKIWKPDVLLYVNMHTRYSEEEIKRLPSNVEVVDFPLGFLERPDAIIPLRNLYLVALAANYGDEICLGATNGDRVLDKSPAFAAMASGLLTYLYQEQHWTSERIIKINVDFKDFTKTELISEYLKVCGCALNRSYLLEEAVENSFSCYNPQHGKECWQCKPCFRKFVAFVNNGYQFSEVITHLALSYIKKSILPEIRAGVYGRRKEEEDILYCCQLLSVTDNKHWEA